MDGKGAGRDKPSTCKIAPNTAPQSTAEGRPEPPQKKFCYIFKVF